MMGQSSQSALQQKTILCLLLLCWNGSLAESTTNSSAVLGRTSDHGVRVASSDEHQLVPFREECVAHVIHVIHDDGTSQTKLKCTLANGLSYLLPSVHEDWISEQMILGELISTETIMTLPKDAMLNQYTHEIHMSEPPKLWNYEMEERERRRKLRRLATTGTKTVLAVRIQATDRTTTPTAANLGTYVFADGGNTYNLKYQTEACSHNALIINKASDRTGTSTSISNGVVTISVSVATSAGESAMENAVTSAILTQFGVTNPTQIADHLMYCYPTGTTADTVVAYAVVGGYLSFYNDAACTYPSAMLHEIGHNYNMGHSSDSSQEYGDQSGLMGFSYRYTDIPKMCFNAAKSWQLGWYASKSDSFTPSSTSPTFSTTLAGVVDYSTTSNRVLLEIRQTSSTTYYYVNYNRATGINAGTQEGANAVLIVSKDTSVETNISMALVSLLSGNSYAINNFDGVTGQTLTVTFTSLVSNEANVQVTLTGFPASSPTTNAPSRVPSKAPSRVPSKAPSRVPSMAPSNSPSTNTNIISSAPSKFPSRSPSKMPSRSMQPSSQPSGSSKPSISNAPSKQATGAPSVTPSVQTVPPVSSPTTPQTSTPTTSPPTASPISRAPTRKPVTAAPSNAIPVERIATVVVEIGIDGLNDLQKICTGIESFLAQGIQAAFNTNTQTTIVCTRGLNRRLEEDRDLQQVVTSFLDYEKPILVTVTTTFANFQQAPRQFGFIDFLETLMISDAAQTQLETSIQQSVGSGLGGVHVRLVDTKRKPILVVAFGDQPPTVSPSAAGAPVTPQSSSPHWSNRYLLSLLLGAGITALLYVI